MTPMQICVSFQNEGFASNHCCEPPGYQEQIWETYVFDVEALQSE